ncbi:MAG: L-2-amino-thiazoline-4-carboxylic acid hydrolase [Burkholderiaceae bacterium]
MTTETARTFQAHEVHELLRRAFAMRAASYAHFYDVLREQLGREQALAICKKATRRMGEAMGPALAGHAPDDLAGLRDAFLSGIIEGQALFEPAAVGVADEGLRIDFMRCPLKEAWEAMGRADGELEDLCEIAGAIDIGLFESAGFRFAGKTWRLGQPGCCRLRVLPGTPDGSAASG